MMYTPCTDEEIERIAGLYDQYVREDDWEVLKRRFKPRQWGDYMQGWYDGFDGQKHAAGPVAYEQGYRDGYAERKDRGIQ